jgi:hypothetical protein
LNAQFQRALRLYQRVCYAKSMLDFFAGVLQITAMINPAPMEGRL